MNHSDLELNETVFTLIGRSTFVVFGGVENVQLVKVADSRIGIIRMMSRMLGVRPPAANGTSENLISVNMGNEDGPGPSGYIWVMANERRLGMTCSKDSQYKLVSIELISSKSCRAAPFLGPQSRKKLSRTAPGSLISS